jgi:hypothetical protein
VNEPLVRFLVSVGWRRRSAELVAEMAARRQQRRKNPVVVSRLQQVVGAAMSIARSRR